MEDTQNAISDNLKGSNLHHFLACVIIGTELDFLLGYTIPTDPTWLPCNHSFANEFGDPNFFPLNVDNADFLSKLLLVKWQKPDESVISSHIKCHCCISHDL